MRSTGLPLEPPRRTCEDIDCPFHGHLKIRGRLLQGTLINDKASKMVVVEREHVHYVKKYMRYERRRTRLHAHKPSCIDVRVGSRVSVAECRPLTKTVSFVVVGA